MRSPAPRHAIALRLTLVGTHPEIFREILADDDLTLEQLREVVRAAFDCFECHHHLFTDNLEGGGWSRNRRRWGDRWTMIDFRDPTIIDEATVRVGSVFSGDAPIYFTHSCDANWLVEIERGVDQVVPASAPRTRVVAGEERAPLACTRGPFEHEVLVAVLADPEHPDHGALRVRLEAAVGPWGSFDPGAFDADAAQRHLDGIVSPVPRGEETTGVLSSLIHRLPRLARPGMRNHIAAAGLDLPVLITADEAEQFTRAFRWLIQRAARGGVPLAEGHGDPAFVRECADALGWDVEEVQRLITASRQLRLLYPRSGRLLAKRSVVTATESPTTFWTGLAEAVTFSSQTDPTTRDLLLLAIADGTLPLGRAGLERVATAYELAIRRSRDHGRHAYGRYPQYTDSTDCGYGDSVMYRTQHDCGERCDCPQIDGTSWHDIVAKSIRDAAGSAAADGAVPVAATMDLDELMTAGVWPEWVTSTVRSNSIFGSTMQSRGGSGRRLDTAAFLRDASGLIDLLSLFGLRRLDDDGWSVPPTLREFARSALQISGPRWGSTVF